MMNLQDALAQQLQQQQQSQPPPPQQDNALQAMQETAGNLTYRRQTPPQLVMQREYAKVLHSLFQKGDELMPSVSKYSGLGGKLKHGIDAVKHGLGKDSPDYANYLQFTRVIAPMAANEMRRSLGGQATNYEAKLMANIIKPDYWDSNPKQALDQYHYLQSTFRQQVIPNLLGSVSKTPGELKKISEEGEGMEQMQGQGQQPYKIYNPQTGRIE